MVWTGANHRRCRPRTALMDGVDSRRVIARCKERLPHTTHSACPRARPAQNKPSD
jgi:hypothetical protein